MNDFFSLIIYPSQFKFKGNLILLLFHSIVMIASVKFGWKQKEIFIEFKLWTRNHYWNGCQSRVVGHMCWQTICNVSSEILTMFWVNLHKASWRGGGGATWNIAKRLGLAPGLSVTVLPEWVRSFKPTDSEDLRLWTSKGPPCTSQVSGICHRMNLVLI